MTIEWFKLISNDFRFQWSVYCWRVFFSCIVSWRHQIKCFDFIGFFVKRNYRHRHIFLWHKKLLNIVQNQNKKKEAKQTIANKKNKPQKRWSKNLKEKNHCCEIGVADVVYSWMGAWKRFTIGIQFLCVAGNKITKKTHI